MEILKTFASELNALVNNIIHKFGIKYKQAKEMGRLLLVRLAKKLIVYNVVTDEKVRESFTAIDDTPDQYGMRILYRGQFRTTATAAPNRTPIVSSHEHCAVPFCASLSPR